MVDLYTLHFDGACWPNPNGRASYGYTIDFFDKQVDIGHGLIGEGRGMSNNLAEYFALFKGLAHVYLLIKGTSVVTCIGDSQLVVRMMSKQNPRGRAEKLYYPAFVECVKMVKLIRRNGSVVNFTWVPRLQNEKADALSNIDQNPADLARGNEMSARKKNKSKKFLTNTNSPVIVK